MVDSKNGSIIWQLNTGRMNVFVGNFIPDQNNDSISDVLASHSSLSGIPKTFHSNNIMDYNNMQFLVEKDGHIILFSGKNGQEIKRIAMYDNAKIFYMPQILLQNSTNPFVLFGTGSPSSPGNLSLAPLNDILSGVLVSSLKNEIISYFSKH